MTKYSESEEVFVEFKLPSLITLDHKSVIETIFEKYEKGQVIIPTDFRVIGVDVDPRENSHKLTITIGPVDSFSVDSLTAKRVNNL